VQYQIGQPAEKRLPLSHLEIVHGRLSSEKIVPNRGCAIFVDHLERPAFGTTGNPVNLNIDSNISPFDLLAQRRVFDFKVVVVHPRNVAIAASKSSP
jgi:hypothetical protein